jgi:hypothetical protein
MELPHKGVYTRLQCSKIHGIGVFAIIDIPKGIEIFSEDQSDFIWLKEKELGLDTLPESIRKLYDDFCVIKDQGDYKMYGCPNNFSNLTISWYLNHSKTPNVYCDQEYNFSTLRDIKAGEELTVNYDTYSDE